MNTLLCESLLYMASVYVFFFPSMQNFASEFRSSVRVDRALYGSAGDIKPITFKLPAQPVKYVPPGYNRLAVEREYDVSPKALFHVMLAIVRSFGNCSNMKDGQKTSDKGPGHQ